MQCNDPLVSERDKSAQCSNLNSLALSLSLPPLSRPILIDRSPARKAYTNTSIGCQLEIGFHLS